MKDSNLPWMKELLFNVRLYSAKSLPHYTVLPASKEEYDYIQELSSEKDAFDELRLKNAMNISIQYNEAKVTTCSSELGKIIIVQLNNDSWQPPWDLWWSIIRILSPKKKVRVAIFAHPQERVLPPKGTTLGPQHINGGYANRCDGTSIVIYRKEEATRVLTHELFHASCSDPYHKDTPFIEADTEAWAEIVLCAIVAKGNPEKWTRYMREQISWAMRQAATLHDWYKVKVPNDYAWRYGVGRIDVWRNLGLSVPNIETHYKPVDSLRLTVLKV